MDPKKTSNVSAEHNIALLWFVVCRSVSLRPDQVGPVIPNLRSYSLVVPSPLEVRKQKLKKLLIPNVSLVVLQQLHVFLRHLYIKLLPFFFPWFTQDWFYVWEVHTINIVFRHKNLIVWICLLN